MNNIIEYNKFKNQFQENKYFKNHNLSSLTKLDIAYESISSNEWGIITKLSERYNVSRNYIYELQNKLKKVVLDLFSNNYSLNETTLSKRNSFEMILSLKCEGKCCISPMSKIMKRFSIPFNSTGFISSVLKKSSSVLDNTLSDDMNLTKPIIFVSDEIFSKSKAILITVEPVSSAILNIELVNNRSKKAWINHWQQLKNEGFVVKSLCSDEGKALISAHKEELSNIRRYPDPFHMVGAKLRKYLNKLSKKAYSLIDEEEKYKNKLVSTPSNKVKLFNRYRNKYEILVKEVSEKIELFDQFNNLYLELVANFNLFDNDGNFRIKEVSLSNIQKLLSSMKALKISGLNQDLDRIQFNLPILLAYLEDAKEIVLNLKSYLPLSSEQFKKYCLGYQYHKNKINVKSWYVKKKYEKAEIELLSSLNTELGSISLEIKDSIYSELDNIVKASSIVETINSILRDYLNASRNHINQDMLNLFKFYHNHRIYSSGKRKGKSPIEILSGKKLEKDWIEILLEKLEKKYPGLFAEKVIEKKVA